MLYQQQLQVLQCQHVRIHYGLLKLVYRLIKGRIELIEERKKKQNDSNFRNLRAVDLIRNVYREHGIAGFYKGVSASYVGVSETIVHFVIYEQVKAQLQILQTQHNISSDETNIYNFFSYLCSAACSKTFATTLCYPHEVVRTRLREEGNKYRTFMQTLKTVYAEESFVGLYRGLLTHLIRQIPVRMKKKTPEN